MELLIKIGIRIIEVLFFGGVVGSVIVVLITGVEDVETALGGGDDEGEKPATATSEPQH